MSTAHLLITTVLANNIHCASCVAYIREVLRDLGPAIWNVDISILSHQVQIRHHENLSATVICQSLNDAAFEIYAATTTDSAGAKISQEHFDGRSDGWLEHAVGYWKRSHQRTSNTSWPPTHDKRRRHIQNCDACKKQEPSAQEDESHPMKEDIGGEKKDAGLGSLSLLAATSKEDTESRASRVLQGHPSPRDAQHPLPEQNIRSLPTSHDRSGGAGVQGAVVIHKDEVGASNSGAQKDIEEHNVLLSISGMTCTSCTGTIRHGLEEMEFVNSVNVTLLTNSATVTFTGAKENADLIMAKITDLGYDASIDKCWPNNAPRGLPFSNALKWRAVLSIGGMTCASCTGSVSIGLEELNFVESVAVDLLTNSGTVIFTGKEHLAEIVEKIEDLGYECTVQECVPDIQRSGEVLVDQGRSVTLSIAGMFCEHCPQRIVEAVDTSFSGQVLVEKSPTMRDPVIEVTYTPQPPDLTIRHIIATICDISDTFKVTVYHPPTLEQRSRAMQLHERRRLLLRLLLSFVVAIPTFLIGVVWMSLVPSTNPTRAFFEQPAWAGNVARSDWALFILATPVMFCAADVFHTRALKEIRALWRRSSRVPVLRRFYRFGSMNLLISAGTSVAYFASLALLIVDATSAITVSGNGTTYFDSVVFLTFFILIGRFLEAYSKAKTGDAVAMLGKLRPSQALLVNTSALDAGAATGSQEIIDQQTPTSGPEQLDVDLLETGDTVLVLHGVSPPADGLVTIGSSQFDESSLTGESRPVIKSAGDKVFAGSINTGKPVTIKITGLNGTSMLDQIVSAVREGQTKRAPVERVADILTGYFVPVITLLAILTFILWFSLGQSGVLPGDYLDANQGGWAFWSLEFAIAVFVVACPCGIGLAAPTAMFVGNGLAAKYGILVRGGGEAFQEASDLDVVVFDKTGTLTEGGSLKVTDYDMLASVDKESIAWAAAKALEESSEHPIARAIVDICQGKDQPSIQVIDVEEVPGRGIRGKFTCASNLREAPLEAAIGNESFIASLGVDTRNYFSHANVSRWKTEGKSVALLAMRDVQEPESRFTLAAQFATTDPIRPEAPQVVRRLQEAGLSVYMLSGDNPTTATSVGQGIGIPTSNIIAGVLPTEKADHIRWLQANAPKRHSTQKLSNQVERRKANIAFVGDGINDAPALTAATVSIAIGSGSDIALSSSSFILLTSNLNTLLTLLDLSKMVFRRIKFNFAWALVYNVCLLPIAAGVIYPASGHPRLGPVWASAAMAASSHDAFNYYTSDWKPLLLSAGHGLAFVPESIRSLTIPLHHGQLHIPTTNLLTPGLKYLITGSTGGLGRGVLSHLASTIPATDFAATSSRPSATSHFENQGLQFRHADYNDLGSLIRAFRGVDKLLFVSSSTFDNAARTKQHLNVVAAAKLSGVAHVNYTSLAFGGYGDRSKTAVQAAHLETEKLLRELGVRHTSVREGIYADAFPLFIDWFPANDDDGGAGFRFPGGLLAEATAKLMLSGAYDGQEMVVLLTGPKAYTLAQVVDVVNDTTGRDVSVERVSQEEYVTAKVRADVGRKGKRFFRGMLSWFEGMEDGEGVLVTGTMREVLVRELRDGMEVIRALLREDRDYEWHQNYMKTGEVAEGERGR